MLESLSIILNALPALLLGALVTLRITFFSVFLGMVGGSLIGIARLSPILPVRWAMRAYVDFFRGTIPLAKYFLTKEPA